MKKESNHRTMKNIHTFESFLSAGEALHENKIDASRLKSTDAISIHGNPDTELAKEFGDDLVIPGGRKGGEVTWKGERIGYVDSFSGLVFTDLDWVADHLEALNRVVAKTGFFYTN